LTRRILLAARWAKCRLGWCAYRPYFDDGGCGGQCVDCGKIVGYTTHAAIRRYIERTGLVLLAALIAGQAMGQACDPGYDLLVRDGHPIGCVLANGTTTMQQPSDLDRAKAICEAHIECKPGLICGYSRYDANTQWVPGWEACEKVMKRFDREGEAADRALVEKVAGSK
jgi:hypothetical protein